MAAMKETLHAAADMLGVDPSDLLAALEAIERHNSPSEEVQNLTLKLVAWSLKDAAAGRPDPGRSLMMGVALEVAYLWYRGAVDLELPEHDFLRGFVVGTAARAAGEGA